MSTPPTQNVSRRNLLAGAAAAAGLSLAAAYGVARAGESPSVAPEGTNPTAADALAGWSPAAPRDEIRPAFSTDPVGGPGGRPCLVVAADGREGLDGWWQRTFPVVGGRHYHFSALFKAVGVALPRRSVVVKIDWYDDRDRGVPLDGPSVAGVLPKMTPMAETEFPDAVVGAPARADGWTEMAGTYLAPPKATRAVVQLHLQWSPESAVRWADVSLAETTPPGQRIARLATVHFRPKGGKSAMENCRFYEPLIAEAARQKADLVVLGETLTYAFTGKSMADAAEPIPGPSTEYFGQLAKQHNCYIVPGLVERDGHLIYNTAVLIGPEGQIVGKYRKTCLPRSEVVAGIMPGKDYPVFDTRFGRVGMMVCYDGFFPEVARELCNGGAEVIAWPVWGCNPMLGRARACENHAYVVSSTYSDRSEEWMTSAVVDRSGQTIAWAKDWSTVAVAEVDLNVVTRWPSLGDFRAEIPRHRPVTPGEATGTGK